MEPVPVYVETAIYLYFLVVATIGLTLVAHCWFERTRHNHDISHSDDPIDDTPTDGSSSSNR